MTGEEIEGMIEETEEMIAGVVAVATEEEVVATKVVVVEEIEEGNIEFRILNFKF